MAETTVRFELRLPVALYDTLTAKCAAEGVSRTAAILKLIANYVQPRKGRLGRAETPRPP